MGVDDASERIKIPIKPPIATSIHSENAKSTSVDDVNGGSTLELDDITNIISQSSKEQLEVALLKLAMKYPSKRDMLIRELKQRKIEREKINRKEALQEKRRNEQKQKRMAALKSPRDGSGTVDRWFHEKAYGFIRRDDGLPDIFCHRKDCWLEPLDRHPLVRSNVEFDIKTVRGKDQAVNVTSVGGENCIGFPRRKGTIKWYNSWNEEGYIIVSDEKLQGDLHFNLSDCWGTEFMTFEEGEEVEFDVRVTGFDNHYATYVTTAGIKIVTCSHCGGFGHDGNHCPRKDQLPCYNCGEQGHRKNCCPKIIAERKERLRLNSKKKKEQEWYGKALESMNHEKQKRSLGILVRWNHDKQCGYIEFKEEKDENGKAKGAMCFAHDMYLDEQHTSPKVQCEVEFDFVADAQGGTAQNVTAKDGGNLIGGQHTGTVKAWSDEEKRGWIQTHDGSKDVAVIADDLWGDLQKLKVGDRVQYDPWMRDRKYFFAVYCSKIDSSPRKARTVYGPQGT